MRLRTRYENHKNVIAFLHRFGHLNKPFGANQDAPATKTEACRILTLKDTCVKEALRSYQNLDVNYDQFAAAVHPQNNAQNSDGSFSPASALVMDLPRCGAPDYSDTTPDTSEAVGSGNWKRCHNVGDFHGASIQLINSPPAFLAPHFDEVKRRIVLAYAEAGLMLHFDGRSPVNITWSFVPRSSGWIGLAQVVNNATCSTSPIFCRYLATYRGGNTDEQIITQWTTLGKHELGHNCGEGHSRGGVMNPSIVNGLPISWRNDVIWSRLAAKFGGLPVPIGPEEPPKLVFAYQYSGGRLEYVSDVPKPSGGFFPRN